MGGVRGGGGGREVGCVFPSVKVVAPQPPVAAVDPYQPEPNSRLEAQSARLLPTWTSLCRYPLFSLFLFLRSRRDRVTPSGSPS